jgi:hypothetical protein
MSDISNLERKYTIQNICIKSIKEIFMIGIIRTDSTNHDFIKLVKLLDAELAIRDGSEYSFYSQYNKLDKIRHVILAWETAYVLKRN